MKALLGAFNQEKVLVGAFNQEIVGAFSVIVQQPVVEPMDRFTALVETQVTEYGARFDQVLYSRGQQRTDKNVI